jgi:SAM-dependent methyltransferase
LATHYDAAVIEREREFHNQRFAEETRDAQEKYYFALRDCDIRYESLIMKHAANAVVLDYGCAKGDWALRIAPTAEKVYGIDISDVAIEAARQTAARMGLSNTQFDAMDAHDLAFPDATFDVVFGLGIIHHLDTRKALTEVARVLKPGGLAIFREPLGYNAAINVYRRLTPAARTIDEHPLVLSDYRVADELFADNCWEFHGLVTLASVPFRSTPLGDLVFKLAHGVDSLLLRVPGLRWQAWAALMVLRK